MTGRPAERLPGRRSAADAARARVVAECERRIGRDESATTITVSSVLAAAGVARSSGYFLGLDAVIREYRLRHRIAARRSPREGDRTAALEARVARLATENEALLARIALIEGNATRLGVRVLDDLYEPLRPVQGMFRRRDRPTRR